MASSSDIFVPVSNFSMDMESYISHSMIKMIQMIIDKMILVVFAIVLIISVIQTFWKNKYIDRLLAYINDAYSDGKFQSNKVYFRKQIIKCYRFDQRFSHIPNPNRSILFIIATHIQILILIAMRTSFIRHNELITDCSLFHYPYKILECENKIDPCQFNDTGIAPQCSYYYFQMTNIIPMITSMITWHYALRYLVVKLVRFIRWILFRDNDQPRRWCCCYRPSPCVLRCLMYFQYIILWLYLIFAILCGSLWNISWFRMSVDILGSTWTPVLMAGDRLCTLSLACAPELIQNWLDATENGAVLHDFESKELLFANAEPLIYLIDKKEESTIATKNNVSETNIAVTVESITYT